MCQGYNSCYLDLTIWRLITWFKEHWYKQNQPVYACFDKCTRCTPTLNDVKILASTSRSLNFLPTLEALYMKEIQPQCNTKDE